MNKKSLAKISIMFGVLILIILGVIFLANVIATNPGSSESNSTSEWTMLNRNLNHTGVYPGSVNPTNFVLLWSQNVSGAAAYSTVIINNTLYVGTNRGADVRRIMAFNLQTKQNTWNFTACGEHLTYADDTIYCIGGTYPDFYAVNATNGTQIWTFDVGGTNNAQSVTVVNSKVYGGASGGAVYAINATNGTQIWSSSPGTDIDITSSPIIIGDVLYIGAGFDGFGSPTCHGLIALNATNGTKIWCTGPGSDYGYGRHPLYSNDIVYYGSDNGNGYFYAINATNGTQIWSYALGDDIDSGSTIYKDIVYFSSTKNFTITALNATNGTRLWNYTTDKVCGGCTYQKGFSISGDILFAGGGNQTYALNATNGNLIWSYTLNYTGGTPIIVDNYLYVGSAYYTPTAGSSFAGLIYQFGTSLTINITYPQNTTYNVNVSELNYTYTHANPSSCWYSINNGTTNSTSVAAGLNFTAVTSYEGSNNWSLYCNDSSANNVSSSVTFFKDSIKPQINITLPLNNTAASDTGLNINYTVSDLNLQTCWWTNNTGLKNWTLTCGVNITNQTWVVGTYTVIVYVNDTANNINSTSVNFSTSTDITAPLVTLILPASGYSITPTQITFQYNVSEINNISSCSLIIGNAIDQTDTTITKDTTQEFLKSFSSYSSYTWQVNCTDSNSNIGNSESRSFSIIAPSGGGGGSGGGSGGGGGWSPPPLEICSDSCVSGQKEALCSNKTTQKTRICGNYDSDSCYEWSDYTFTNCNEGEECSFGLCIANCTANWQCTDWSSCFIVNEADYNNMITGSSVRNLPTEKSIFERLISIFKITGAAVSSQTCQNIGEKICHETKNNYYQECIKKGKNLVWNSYKCASGLICSDGNCVCSNKNSCDFEGEKICKGSYIYECKKDKNSCLKLVQGNRCATGLLCEQGNCICSNLNSCNFEGGKRCVDINKFQECKKDKNSCFKWGMSTKCGSGEVCAEGECVKEQTDVCEMGNKTCIGNNVYECESYKNRYNRWIIKERCTGSLECLEGACVCKKTYDSCDIEGQKTCTGNTPYLCEKDSQGCLKLVPGVCIEGTTCKEGECVREHCINNIQDYDEEGIDCGGTCKPCSVIINETLPGNETLPSPKEVNIQTRTCTDLNNCGIKTGKPIEVKLCGETCTESWQCTDWSSCINGKETRICMDLNNCGTTLNKPGIIKDCGCDESWICSWTNCTEAEGKNYYVSPYDCTDINRCGSETNKPERIQCVYEPKKGIWEVSSDICIPDWQESSWGGCEIDYSLKDLIETKYILKSEEERAWTDLKGCGATKTEKRECSLSVPITARKVEWCKEKYVEIYEKSTGKLVSRVKETELANIKKLDIGFMVSNFTGYCDYCFDKIKNYDEEEIDCGGLNCPPCIEYAEGFRWWMLFYLIFWLLLILLILIYLYLYYLDISKKNKEKKIIKSKSPQKGLLDAQRNL